MEKKIVEFLGSVEFDGTFELRAPINSDLADLQLALVGGGIGDTVL